MDGQPTTGDIRMRGFRRRHDLEAVIQQIDARVAPLSVEWISSLTAVGRQLADIVVAAADVPHFDRAAMDGYAVRGEETFGASPYNELPFRIVGESFPGRCHNGALKSGEAVRIMTGAALPAGADTIVVAESTRATDAIVQVCESTPLGKNVGKIGEDVRAGAVIVSPPRQLRPQDIAVFLAAGVAQVKVHRRPNVAIIVTGNELVPAGQMPFENQIVDSNSVMLAALVERDGGIVDHRNADGSFAILPDDRSAILQTVRNASAESDCILLCGGSSVGLEDHGPSIVSELGELPIHGLALRPASPAGLGFIAGKPVFLVPGNPVSCLCAYDLFVGRAVRLLGGRSRASPYRQSVVRLAVKLTSDVGRVDYVRVRFTAPGRIEPLAIGGAANLSSTVRADGYVVVPKDLEGYPEETDVVMHLYDTV